MVGAPACLLGDQTLEPQSMQVERALCSKNVIVVFDPIQPASEVRGNRLQLQQLVLNVVTNAVQALAEHDTNKSPYTALDEVCCVNKPPRLPPPSLDRSKAWLANRRRDPTPINRYLLPMKKSARGSDTASR
jgi:hypothetical protein